MAGAARVVQSGCAAANRGLAELAAVARGIWRRASQQFHAYGRFSFGELELHAAPLPRHACASVIDQTFGNGGAFVAGAVVDWLVVDRWLRGWVGIEANSVGKHAFVLRALLGLSVRVPLRFDLEVLPFPLFAASGLGSASRFPDFENEIHVCASHRRRPDGNDRSDLEQREDSDAESAEYPDELGSEHPRVVSRVHGVETPTRTAVRALRLNRLSFRFHRDAS